MKSQVSFHFTELSVEEASDVQGGGPGAELAYYITYAAVATSPAVLIVKYNLWALNLITKG